MAGTRARGSARGAAPRSLRRACLGVLALALSVGCWLRLDAADHDYLARWDESYHALVAKNLARHPLEPTLYEEHALPSDRFGWSASHVWLHKPPVALWAMAASHALFGPAERSLRWPSVVLGTASIALTFALALQLLGPPLAWGAAAIAALLHAINPLLIRLTSGTVPADHVDALLVCFVELAVLALVGASRRRSLVGAALAGGVVGLGFLTKSWPALLPLAVWMPMLLAKDHGEGGSEMPRRAAPLALLAAALVGLVVVAAPWTAYTHLRWPEEAAYEAAYAWRHLSEPLEGHAQPASWYVALIPLHLGGPPLLAWGLVAGAICWGSARAVRRREPGVLTLLVWSALPYLVFSLAATRLYAYTAIALPGLWILSGGAAAAAWSAPGRTLRWAVAALLALHLGLVSAERLAADYASPPWSRLYEPSAFRNALLWIDRQPGRKLVLNVREGWEIHAMYYADCVAYPHVPPPDRVARLLDEGWSVYLLLDALDSGRPQIDALAQADLLPRLQPLAIRPPPPKPIVHPYRN